jgi:hypothetical protein
VFGAAAAAIIPLAQWIRRATEQIANRAGSSIGGLLNVTLGNAAELIVALFVLMSGNTTVVKATITGSIIGNSLLGLGLAILAGTWRRDRQTFSPQRAGASCKPAHPLDDCAAAAGDVRLHRADPCRRWNRSDPRRAPQSWGVGRADSRLRRESLLHARHSPRRVRER